MAPSRFDPEVLHAITPDKLAAALAGPPRVPKWAIADRVPSAVCVPLVETSGGLEVWIIRRPDGMRHHARELAFPGGKAEPSDACLLDTALRETEEELGVPRAAARVLGALTPVPPATSRFVIHPFVTVVDPSVVPLPAAREVAELIRAPIAAFFDGRIGYSIVEMSLYVSPIFTFASGSMYGASAHVLLELLETCEAITGARLPKPTRADQVPWA